MQSAKLWPLEYRPNDTERKPNSLSFLFFLSFFFFLFEKDARPARWGPPDGWEPPGARSFSAVSALIFAKYIFWVTVANFYTTAVATTASGKEPTGAEQMPFSARSPAPPTGRSAMHSACRSYSILRGLLRAATETEPVLSHSPNNWRPGYFVIVSSACAGRTRARARRPHRTGDAALARCSIQLA